MTDSKKGRNYNQSARILLSIIFVPILFCGGCFFLYTHPWVTWLHANEMQSVLEHYEQIRSAVFDGREQPAKLEEIASKSNLDQLQQSLANPNSLDKKYVGAQPINITDIRKYEANCSVAIINPYFGWKDVGFVLFKSDGTWKVQQIYYDVDAGLFGNLPLFCNN